MEYDFTEITEIAEKCKALRKEIHDLMNEYRDCYRLFREKTRNVKETLPDGTIVTYYFDNPNWENWENSETATRYDRTRFPKY